MTTVCYRTGENGLPINEKHGILSAWLGWIKSYQRHADMPLLLVRQTSRICLAQTRVSRYQSVKSLHSCPEIPFYIQYSCQDKHLNAIFAFHSVSFVHIIFAYDMCLVCKHFSNRLRKDSIIPNTKILPLCHQYLPKRKELSVSRYLNLYQLSRSTPYSLKHVFITTQN